MSKRRKILFVDDDPEVLDGLRRTFRSMRDAWALAFARNSREALTLMNSVPFDVVVSDLKIAGMDGAEFLTEIMHTHPGVVRIVLSGQSDKDLAMKSLSPAHQYLSKPYNTDKLKGVLSKAIALRDKLADDSIKTLVSQMGTLPSLPALYDELMHELNSEDGSIQRVSEIITQDVGMTAKIMQLVNSAFFGASQNIDDPVQAVARLGLETVQGLVLSVQIFSQLEATQVEGLSLNRLWNHSMATGSIARDLAKKEKSDRSIMGDSFIAGMLHDAGMLILAANLPEIYSTALATAKERGITISDAELMSFGTTHAEVGAYLLGLWGLPDRIVEAVTYHNRPDEAICKEICPLTFVHAADALDHETRDDEDEGLLNTDYLETLGLTDRIPAWRERASALTEAPTE